MKQTQNCFLMPFLGLAFLRKEFLKSRPCLQDQRTPQLFCRHAASDAIDAMKGPGFSWVPKAACNHITFSWKLFFVHALGHSERNFREHLILLELKCIFFFIFVSCRCENAEFFFVIGELAPASLSFSTVHAVSLEIAWWAVSLSFTCNYTVTHL